MKYLDESKEIDSEIFNAFEKILKTLETTIIKLNTPSNFIKNYLTCDEILTAQPMTREIPCEWVTVIRKKHSDHNNIVPNNNQGRSTCYWCNEPTITTGFTLDMNVCTKCKK